MSNDAAARGWLPSDRRVVRELSEQAVLYLDEYKQLQVDLLGEVALVRSRGESKDAKVPYAKIPY